MRRRGQADFEPCLRPKEPPTNATPRRPAAGWLDPWGAPVKSREQLEPIDPEAAAAKMIRMTPPMRRATEAGWFIGIAFGLGPKPFLRLRQAGRPQDPGGRFVLVPQSGEKIRRVSVLVAIEARGAVGAEANDQRLMQ